MGGFAAEPMEREFSFWGESIVDYSAIALGFHLLFHVELQW